MYLYYNDNHFIIPCTLLPCWALLPALFAAKGGQPSGRCSANLIRGSLHSARFRVSVSLDPSWRSVILELHRRTRGCEVPRFGTSATSQLGRGSVLGYPRHAIRQPAWRLDEKSLEQVGISGRLLLVQPRRRRCRSQITSAEGCSLAEGISLLSLSILHRC
jgi:hypothetical protein